MSGKIEKEQSGKTDIMPLPSNLNSIYFDVLHILTLTWCVLGLFLIPPNGNLVGIMRYRIQAENVRLSLMRNLLNYHDLHNMITFENLIVIW